MPRIRYEDWKPNSTALHAIRKAGKWVRDINGTKNADPNYKWLGEIINKARLAGLLDWDYIVDRTRALAGTSHWGTPGSIIDSAAASFRLRQMARPAATCQGLG